MFTLSEVMPIKYPKCLTAKQVTKFCFDFLESSDQSAVELKPEPRAKSSKAQSAPTIAGEQLQLTQNDKTVEHCSPSLSLSLSRGRTFDFS